MAGTLHRENPLGERAALHNLTASSTKLWMAGTLHRENPLGERAALHNLTASSTKLWMAGTLHREKPLGERAALHNLTASSTKLWMAGTLHRENPLGESCPTQSHSKQHKAVDGRNATSWKALRRELPYTISQQAAQSCGWQERYIVKTP